ncbi:MAG: hypothetical protein ACLFSY_00600 [Desulfonatronovibrionaceae bacterium]
MPFDCIMRVICTPGQESKVRSLAAHMQARVDCYDVHGDKVTLLVKPGCSL